MKQSPLLRLGSLFLICFVLAGAVVHPAGGQISTPPKERFDAAAARLSAVEGYYGPLAARQGTARVVVELADAPSTQVYAAAGGGVSRNAIDRARVQLDTVRMAQERFSLALSAAGVVAREIYRTQRVFNGVALELDSRDVRAVAALPGVKAVHPLVPKERDHTTSVPLTGALQVWANATPYQGDGVDIGIIDTGIDYTHKNFGGPGTPAAYSGNNRTVVEPGTFPTAKVVGGYDFAGDNYDANGRFGSVIPTPDPDPLDCGGHGSHVAGTAAGLGVLKTGANPAPADYAAYAGLAQGDYINLWKIGPGMAPRANLYALKVFGCSGSTDLTDLAIEWAVDPNGDGDLSDHLDVINMSLGSAYGSENDPSAIASNNAVLAGVIVVASAGNNGDVYYVSGSPGVARMALSVANALDSGGVTGAFEVTNVTAPVNLQGLHPAVGAAFGPALTTAGRTGALVLAAPADGCTALGNAAAVAGKIALIDRGGCDFVVKVQNAQAAGAVGVLVANNQAGPPFAMGGTPATPLTIPAAMTTRAVGDALKGVLAGGVDVRLTSQYDDTLVAIDPQIEDTIAASSSRGPRRGDSGLKPDLAAPGDTIYSAAAGTGSGGISLGGSSMASPHVAGAMALLRQARPGWSAVQLKALVMNTATREVFTSTDKTTPVNPERTGTGRLDLVNALNSGLIAYNQMEAEAVNVSFGLQDVVESGSVNDLTTDKTIILQNMTGANIDVSLSFTPRYPANPGVSYNVLGPPNRTVPANGSITVTVRQTINASALERLRDPGAALTDVPGSSRTRDYLTQSGGYLVVAPAGGPVLRVSVYAVHRQAVQRAAQASVFGVGMADEGTLSLAMNGTGFVKPDEASLVYVHELLFESQDEPWSTGINDSADLKAVGASTDYSVWALPGDFSDVTVYLGAATQGPWSTPNEVEFDMYIDTNEDGIAEWVLFNVQSGFFTGGITDTQVVAMCNLAIGLCYRGLPVNGVYADTPFTLGGTTSTKLNGRQFHSNVITLPFPVTFLGLGPGNTDFAFYVDTFNRETPGLVDTTPWMVYDFQKPAFDTVDPVNTGIPLAVDDGNLQVAYDKSDLYNQGGALGLLLNHHQNQGDKGEVVRFDRNYAALAWEKYRPAWVIPGSRLSIPVTVVNETLTSCTFDLGAVQGGTPWPVVFSAPAVFLIPGSAATVQVFLTAPAGTSPGTSKEITLTATCRQNNAIAPTTLVRLTAAYGYWMPLIGR